MRKYASIQIVLYVLLVTTVARAQQTVAQADFTQAFSFKPTVIGFGGAYRALADSNATILLNPAGIALKKGTAAAAGDYMHSSLAGSDSFSASIVDFKATDTLAMALEYDYSKFSLGSQITVHHITLGAAMPFGDVLYVGANVKGYFTNVDSPILKGPNGVDADLGVLFKPIPMWSLALTTQNLFLGNNRQNFPFLMGFATALDLTPTARLAIDVTRDFKTSSANKINAYFGGEFRAAEGIYLRGGFGLDKVRDDNFWSVGLGVNGPRFALTFGYSRFLNPSDNTFAGGVEFSF